jgi:hypothetical protein
MKHHYLFLAALSLFAPIVSNGADTKPIRVLIWDQQQPTQKTAYGPNFLGETMRVIENAVRWLGQEHK